MTIRHPISIMLATLLLSSTFAADSSSGCRAVKHYGVNGCELLRNQTCPRGYHKQSVGPSNPQMKSPTYLMCVADKSSLREQPPKKRSKTDR